MSGRINKVECRYISCACNRTLNASDWGINGLICYGACNAVAIYDTMADGGGRVLTTLVGHKGRVNAVKWVTRKNFSETELVSVSSDNFGLVWTASDNTFVISGILKGHENSVTAVDTVYQQGALSESTLVIVTASVDSTFRVWERELKQGVICRQVVSLNSGFCTSVSMISLDCATILLACALDDCQIHLYSEEGGTFAQQQVLKGHDDWVTALNFIIEDCGDLLLASGSQDSTVRLWKFHEPRSNINDQQFHVEEKILRFGSQTLAISLESVLLGHDGRVNGVRWHPPILNEECYTQPLKLLTASLDKTVVLWSPEDQSGVWLEEARMGEVGGNTLGFYGACFGPSGSAILAHSFQGGFHIWRKFEEGWYPGVVVGGHFDAVSDLAWEPRHGRFLLSVSSDQTTRLHAPWIPSHHSKDSSWHEIARPQVHGYDLVCLAVLPDFRYVSGADEKVVRTFTAPQNFLDNFKRLCLKNKEGEDVIEQNISLPTGGAVPVLGLSNKAVFQNEINQQSGERHVKDQYDNNSYFTPQKLKEPPTEDNLLQNTLWPETMKLYGHGYEIFSLATTADGKLLASACKATNEEHAAILLWDTEIWQKVARLISHQLTITQMQFSPDGQFLLSVSRDRCWSIFQRDDGPEKYKLIARTNKLNGIHTRIIWCCAWSHDSTYFATGSRDGKMVVWGKVADSHPGLGGFGASSEHLDLPKESITSVAFGTGFILTMDEYLIAVGSEAGDIRLYSWNKNSQSIWTFLHQLTGNFAHHLAVKRLAFRPVLGKAGELHESPSQSVDISTNVVQLASCGLDHTVKICDVYILCNKT